MADVYGMSEQSVGMTAITGRQRVPDVLDDVVEVEAPEPFKFRAKTLAPAPWPGDGAAAGIAAAAGFDPWLPDPLSMEPAAAASIHRSAVVEAGA